MKKAASDMWITLTVLLILAVVLTSCTQLPIREFSSYKETFNRARMAGEEVLLDYGAALEETKRVNEKKRAELLAANKSEKTQPTSPSISSIPFDPVVDATRTVEIDVIGVRMQAWEVVARYNDALTALAEGKRAAELSATVEGLANSLSNFPIAQVADAVGSFSPWLGALKVLVAAVEMERTRLEFLDAVIKGAPLIHGTRPVTAPEAYCTPRALANVGLIGLLKADASDFYCTRLGLHNIAKSEITDSAAELGRQFFALSQHYKPDDRNRLKDLIDVMNGFFARMGVKSTISLGANPTKTYTDNIHSQLVQIKQQVLDKAKRVELLEAALAAYQQTLVSYVKLIEGVSKSAQALRVAAENPVQTLPSTEELVRVYIELKQAIETYRNIRRS